MEQHTQYKLYVQLPDDFMHTLHNVADDELQVATEKWGVHVDEETARTIQHHAFQQLAKKVSVLSKHTWNLDDTVVVNIRSTHPRVIKLPSNNEALLGTLITRETNRWAFADSPGDTVVRGEDFYQSLCDTMQMFLRTAVFYGVGSYG